MKRARRRPVIAALVIGIGLIAAPAIFQMFSRAPLGATMINDFRPFMTSEQVDLFHGYLAQIDAANNESIDSLRGAMVDAGITDEASYESDFASIAGLNEKWPAVKADMGDLIDRMENNLDNYAAVDAMPSFDLFPWFFVFPGLLVVLLAAWALHIARRDGDPPRRLILALIAVGLAVVAAPAMFQMFTRAPKGGDMITDFRPMMTRERVIDVQGHFITLGTAEGQLRNAALPALAEAQATSVDQVGSAYPAISEFSADWPTILTDFSPMIATMSDNVDNFAAVDALPPFPLFPWFFVLPGLMIAGAAGLALKAPREAVPDKGVDDDDSATLSDNKETA